MTITRAQRDAIYEIVINHLTAIGDVWLCVERREFADAKRMGRDFAEDLRLLDDLGWAQATDRETVALTVPPDELTRTLARLHRDAAGSLGTYVSRPKDDEELAPGSWRTVDGIEPGPRADFGTDLGNEDARAGEMRARP
ncbi:MAG: hypothetical protein ACRDPC_15260 [Solirubrobacteraceae bacterium]